MAQDIQGGLSHPAVNITLEAMQQTHAEEQIEQSSEQLSSKLSFQTAVEDLVNPLASRLLKAGKTIKTHKNNIQKLLKGGEKGPQLGPIERIKDFAQQFQQRNPELKAGSLVLLRDRIKPGDTKDDILRKLQEFFPDVSLADEALEFLLETTDGELAQAVQEARASLTEQSGREITAGRNIAAEARDASSKGLGTPTDLRDMYRNITGNPRDSTTLFQELSQRYPFKELKKVVDFLLHSLGSDMKAKGPSIPHGQLFRLLTETRSLQAILGVYRFFRNRMGLMEKLFEKDGMDMPSQLTFESMAKEFMSFVGERYPTPDKALQTAVRLGIEKWILAKIIALSQFRDAIREVAVNQIYRSLQHRDEVYLALLEALEELEDELEELLDRDEKGREKEEEEEEEEEKKGGKGKDEEDSIDSADEVE